MAAEVGPEERPPAARPGAGTGRAVDAVQRVELPGAVERQQHGAVGRDLAHLAVQAARQAHGAPGFVDAGGLAVGLHVDAAGIDGVLVGAVEGGGATAQVHGLRQACGDLGRGRIAAVERAELRGVEQRRRQQAAGAGVVLGAGRVRQAAHAGQARVQRRRRALGERAVGDRGGAGALAGGEGEAEQERKQAVHGRQGHQEMRSIRSHRAR